MKFLLMEIQFMPAPYSLDLRQKVLGAIKRQVSSQREIAELLASANRLLNGS